METEREPSDEEIDEAIEYIDKLNIILDKEIKKKKELGPLATAVYEKGVGRHMIVARDVWTKQFIEDHKMMVLLSLIWNDDHYLHQFIGLSVEDNQGKRHYFETDLKELKRFIETAYQQRGKT